MFHSHDGWFWERTRDGGVRIVKCDDARAGSPTIAEHLLTADEWASIVSTVSAGDEVDGRFYAAKAFHESKGPVKVVPDPAEG